MSISGTSKSIILTQKLDALKRQGKKLHLIIAPPRSVSTAFTRALCHASDSDGVHEILHALEETQNNEGVHDVLDNIQPHKDNVIIKEMAQTDIGHPETYSKLLGIIMDKAEAPIIMITANPKTIFLSMMQVCAKNIIQDMQKDRIHQYERSKTTLEKFMKFYERDINNDITYTNNNIIQTHQLINDNQQEFLIFNANDIKTNPQATIDVVTQTWFSKISSDRTLELAPVVEKFTVQSSLSQKWTSFIKKEYTRNAEYLLAYNDPWVSAQDREKQYFQPHSQATEDIEFRIDKIKDSISTNLISTFENIQESDTHQFGLMQKIDSLIKTSLLQIKNPS